MNTQQPAAYLIPAPAGLDIYAQAQAAALAADIDRTGRAALVAAAGGDLDGAMVLFREAASLALAARATQIAGGGVPSE